MTEKLSSNRAGVIEENIKRIRQDIAETAIKAGRSEKDIRLMAVTKTIDTENINNAIKSGMDLLGENKVQELLSKLDQIDLSNAKMHLIGRLQTNKVKKIVGEVDLIQSVDSLKLAKEIDKQANRLSIKQDILLQVNIGREESKGGFDPDELIEMVFEIASFKGLSIKGLMTIPPICDKKADVCKYFYNMHKLFVDIGSKKIDNIDMCVLSMGMSSDYKEAIEMGTNLIRIGSAIFGERT